MALGIRRPQGELERAATEEERAAEAWADLDRAMERAALVESALDSYHRAQKRTAEEATRESESLPFPVSALLKPRPND